MLGGGEGGGQPTYGKFHMFRRFFKWKLPLESSLYSNVTLRWPYRTCGPWVLDTSPLATHNQILANWYQMVQFSKICNKIHISLVFSMKTFWRVSIKRWIEVRLEKVSIVFLILNIKAKTYHCNGLGHWELIWSSFLGENKRNILFQISGKRRTICYQFARI